MTRAARRHTLLGLMVVGALVALWPATALAAPKPGLSVGAVTAEPGRVSFVVTPIGLAPGTVVEPGSIRVTVDGQNLDVTADQSLETTGLPARGMMVVLCPTGQFDETDLADAKAAALGSTASLPPDVRVGLVVARATPSVVLEPTRDRDAFAAAVAGVQPKGQAAALRDTVMAGARAFDSAAFPAGTERRLLILTNGRRGNPTITTAALRSALSAGRTVADVVALDYSRNRDATGLAEMAALAAATGGRSVTVASPTAARDAAAVPVYPFAIKVAGFVPASLAGRSTRLTVATDRGDLTGTADVTFAGEPATSGGARSASWVPNGAAWAIGAVLFLGIAVAVLALLWPRSAKHERIKQIEHFGPGRASATPKPQPEGSAGSVIARTALAATSSMVRSGQMETRITQRLERAGIRLRAAEWVLLRICISVASGALLFAASNVLGGVMGLIFGWLVTLLYQTVKMDRRMAAFTEQLPDALQLMIGSLRAGFSLPQSLEALVREAPEPVAAEFGRALSEHRLGADVSEALERVAQRTESEDLSWAVMAVRIQREVGGNLAEVLQTTVDTMRERSRLRRHVRSLSAEGRISAWVLIGLPIFLAMFMLLYRRDYMAPLIHTPFGITMLIGGGLLFVIGIFWMTRLVKVDA